MDRRTFVWLLGAGAIACPVGAFAQTGGKLRKVGILNVLPRDAPLSQQFRRGLAELGYVEGKNIAFEYRSGPYRDFPQLAEDLVNQKVDVIYAVMEPAAVAAKGATTTIPIVFAVIGDPVRTGLVASLSHPGANLTGLTAFGSELGGKRIELLKELIPRLAQVGVLWNPAVVPTRAADGRRQLDPLEATGLEKTQEAGRQRGVQVRSFPVLSASDFDDALQAVTRDGMGALVVEEDSLTYSQRDRIIDFAAVHKLPAIYGYRDYAASGGLMSYGAYLPELMRRAMVYIDKILKGAKPPDLPVEQPEKFELVINLKTAKALGLTVPQSLLLRADEVIE